MSWLLNDTMMPWHNVTCLVEKKKKKKCQLERCELLQSWPDQKQHPLSVQRPILAARQRISLHCIRNTRPPLTCTAVLEQFLLKGSPPSTNFATAKTFPCIKYSYHSIWYFFMKETSFSAILWGTLGTSCVVPTGKWYHTETIKHHFHLCMIRWLALPPPRHRKHLAGSPLSTRYPTLGG